MNHLGVSANRVQQAVRLSNIEDTDVGPLRLVRGKDGLVVQAMARMLAQNMGYSPFLLTTGLGIHPSGDIPVRLPAMLLPTVRMLERLEQIHLSPPRCLIYSVPNFIADTNGFARGDARETAHRMMQYLQAYMRRFHEKVYRCMHFTVVDADHEEGITAVHEDIRALVRSGVSDVVASLEQLRLSEQRHSPGHADAYAKYAAANAYYSGAGSTYPFVEHGDTERGTVLPVGGISERPFFSIASHVAEMRGKQVVPLLFSKIASRPAYYPYHAFGDPLSAEGYQSALRRPLPDGHINADLQALLADGATPELLEDIYPAQA